MGISVTHSGSFKHTESFLRAMQRLNIGSILDKYAKDGVNALSTATPRDTGRTASSWGYRIERKGSSYTIWWTNDDIENGFPVALMIQYGHGTGTGGYISGYDYINPAIRPVMDRIADEVWKAVTSA